MITIHDERVPIATEPSIWLLRFALLVVLAWFHVVALPLGSAPAFADEEKLYTNPRFGFSLRYPAIWRLGEPMPDGIGMIFHLPGEQSQVALSGFMNLVQGSNQDGRQTLDEFAAAHRKILHDLYARRHRSVRWNQDEATSLGGFPAKRLSFDYQDEQGRGIVEIHIFSLGRNEGRGVRIKLPAAEAQVILPTIEQMLRSYQAGRDQNAVSPVMPKAGQSRNAEG
ncbi:MAG TPA: hypothetical protein VFS39_18150 [Nitrospira sp.]|nr:hypothetical protein [Nitrospira sp.]